jgi:hypothetical protein
MSRMPTEHAGRGVRMAGEGQRGHEIEEWESGRRIPGWLIAGLVAAGLGAWALYYFGPDLRRYLKIERM